MNEIRYDPQSVQEKKSGNPVKEERLRAVIADHGLEKKHEKSEPSLPETFQVSLGIKNVYQVMFEIKS